MQGIGFMFSSSEEGDEVLNTGLKQVDHPTADPWVTSAGGTSDAIGPEGDLEGQTGWGTEKYNLNSNGKSWIPIASNPFLYGAGGGFWGSTTGRATGTAWCLPARRPGAPSRRARRRPTTGLLVGETQKFPGGVHYDQYRIGRGAEAPRLSSCLRRWRSGVSGARSPRRRPTAAGGRGARPRT